MEEARSSKHEKNLATVVGFADGEDQVGAATNRPPAREWGHQAYRHEELSLPMTRMSLGLHFPHIFQMRTQAH